MQKVTKKIIFLIGIILMMACILGASVYAANEDVVIVKENENKYIIYLKDYLNEGFEFAFSNNSSEEEANLNFIDSALDKPETGANNIAYVDGTTAPMFSNPTYMWIRKNGTVEVTAKQIDIADNILKAEIEEVGKTSQIIPIKIETRTVEDTTNEEGLHKTIVVGIIKLINDNAKTEYQLIKVDSEENKELFSLAELIEKNEFTDMYTKVKANKEFSEAVETAYGKVGSENWKTVEAGEIEESEETGDKEKYILWLKDGEKNDVHFLTSTREENDEWVKQEIKTILPYTYDSNALVIALGAVIIAIIIVAARVIILKKKELKG